MGEVWGLKNNILNKNKVKMMDERNEKKFSYSNAKMNSTNLNYF